MNKGMVGNQKGRFIPPRVYTVVTAPRITPDINNYDVIQVLSLSVAPTFLNPAGQPVDFQRLVIAIKDDGTARALTWGSLYKASGTPLPTTTVAGKFLTLGFIWRQSDLKWHCVASAQET